MKAGRTALGSGLGGDTVGGAAQSARLMARQAWAAAPLAQAAALVAQVRTRFAAP
eukprot:CAMPEP_0174704240 /NCGR_PEP_ID=MMETSP1094-20130205/7909_1 /TAXON_ID=156173 /ORGANISM="Chrysochromulina brevifilum, Strain UTEX LB 985" /LENGTH=54 /DNA_ID=CAMNT_0015902279 /DNA_START=594 /DNA_END=756 /DNA_ORIENTATION=+